MNQVVKYSFYVQMTDGQDFEVFHQDKQQAQDNVEPYIQRFGADVEHVSPMFITYDCGCEYHHLGEPNNMCAQHFDNMIFAESNKEMTIEVDADDLPIKYNEPFHAILVTGEHIRDVVYATEIIQGDTWIVLASTGEIICTKEIAEFHQD